MKDYGGTEFILQFLHVKKYDYARKNDLDTEIVNE